MAQIIKHRKGHIEGIGGVTPRKAELVVTTGSQVTGLDTAVVFVGHSGTAMSPVNKILTGTSTPNVSANGDFNSRIDGLPFYNTNDEKLYIISKSGNLEVKATANTGGTNIVSGSTDSSTIDFSITDGKISGNVIGGVYSSSAQVASDFQTDNRSLNIGSGDFTTTGSGSFADIKVSGNATIDGNIVLGGNITIGNESADTVSFGGEVASHIIPSADNTFNLGSASDKFAEIHATTLNGAINATNGVVSGSEQSVAHITGADLDMGGNKVLFGNVYSTEGDLPSATTYHGMFAHVHATGHGYFAHGGNWIKLQNYGGVISGSAQVIDALPTGTVSGSGQISADETDGWAADVKTQLDANTVITGSSQVALGDVNGFTSYSSSVDSRTAALESAVGAGSNIDGRLTSLETFSGSQESKDTTLATYTASVDNSLSSLNSYTSSLKTAISVDGANVSVLGNLDVAGTTTTIDSTTVQIGDNIIELNGSGVANGGIYVADATAPNTDTGSIVWDSTNDYWKAGTKGNEIKILRAEGDGVVSGSDQVIDILGSLNSYTASNDTTNTTQNSRLDQLSTETGSIATAQATQNSRLDQLSTETGSIATAQATQNSRLDQLSTETGSIATEQAAQDDRLDNIETFTASLSTNFEERGQGIISSSVQTVSALDSQNVNLGGISGSSLDITGNAKIDGNIVIGGNLTLGNEASDTISFAGDVNSNIIPETDDNFNLGSSTDKFAEVHATTLFGAINATNGVISGSAQVIDALPTGTVSGSSQIVAGLSNQATDFGGGRVSGDNFGDALGTSAFTGSFTGDGSGLTGLSTDLTISDGLGNSNDVDLINDTLTFDSGSGGTGIEVTVGADKVSVTGVDASTNVKGVASFSSTNFGVSSGVVSIKAGGVPAAALNSDVAGDGIELDGTNNDLNVLYGSTSNTAVQGNTTISVTGTANEVEITGTTAQALGGGASYTIGLPNDVTVSNDLTVNGNVVLGNAASDTVTVTGNLSVLGTTTTIDSTTVQIGDNILELNIGGAQTNAGLLVTDAQAPNTASGSLLWDGTNDYWMGGAAGSEKEFARLNASPTTNTVLKSDSNGLLVDSTITDDGTDVTLSGDLKIQGLTATSFVYVDNNQTLQVATPSQAGDVIQWNGSSFVASNEIDGGSF